VQKAGDIIPEVVCAHPERRDGREVPFAMPAVCPSCGEPVFREEGEAAVRCTNSACPAQLARGIEHFASKDAMDIDGLGPQIVEALIRETYRLEKAEDALSLENDGQRMCVTVAYCPAVRHLRATGREVCEWFSLSTETVMQTIASQAGLRFEMLSYDTQSGAAKYIFEKE
jgi:NAD-dependent DNA ligase